jgi:hypothetical protein
VTDSGAPRGHCFANQKYNSLLNALPESWRAVDYSTLNEQLNVSRIAAGAQKKRRGIGGPLSGVPRSGNQVTNLIGRLIVASPTRWCRITECDITNGRHWRS